MNWTPPPGPRHWHLTSAQRDPGDCAACDKERSLISVTDDAGAVTVSDRSVTVKKPISHSQKPLDSAAKQGK
jgi:hypothetical protein